jgi:hypothetical protein
MRRWRRFRAVQQGKVMKIAIGSLQNSGDPRCRGLPLAFVVAREQQEHRFQAFTDGDAHDSTSVMAEALSALPFGFRGVICIFDPQRSF